MRFSGASATKYDALLRQCDKMLGGKMADLQFSVNHP